MTNRLEMGKARNREKSLVLDKKTISIVGWCSAPWTRKGTEEVEWGRHIWGAF